MNPKSNAILFDPTGARSVEHQLFGLLFACQLSSQVFVRDTELTKSLLQNMDPYLSGNPCNIHCFTDWMNVYEFVRGGDLLVCGFADVMTGVADRMGAEYIPIPDVPVGWHSRNIFIQKSFRRVVMLGPESSGKSYTAKYLAQKFSLPMVDEYTRFYFNFFGMQKASVTNLWPLALGQRGLEMATYLGSSFDSTLLVCDSSSLQVLVWGKLLYGVSDLSFESFCRQDRPQHVLMMSPDIPWVADGQRANPNDRQQFFEMCKSELLELGVTFDVIDGPLANRLQTASNCIQKSINLLSDIEGSHQ
ncbi:MAG: ATP-binding protein [Proteobacteria bacterium]|nr:ATP-binding protein [Pseudomonadota bacterium]